MFLFLNLQAKNNEFICNLSTIRELNLNLGRFQIYIDLKEVKKRSLK
jgi:hypothetical protein